jgi:tetratricopeptide (TPR) repeat protein
MSDLDETKILEQIKNLIDKKEFEKAYSFYEAALKISRNKLNTKMADVCLSGMAKCLGGMAMSLNDNGKWEEAVKTWQKVEKITRDIGDKTGLGISLDNIRSCTGRLYKIYEGSNNYLKAVECLAERERVCRELDNKNELWKTLYEQSYLLFNHLNDPQKAKSKCEEAIEILPDTPDGPNFIMGAIQMLTQIEAKLHTM